MKDEKLVNIREKFLVGDDVGLVIFDVDNTLAIPDDRSFYSNFSNAVHRGIMHSYGLSEERAIMLANHFRRTKGGGEFAFFDEDIESTAESVFGEKLLGTIPQGKRPIEYLYDAFAEIDPVGSFTPNEKIINVIDTAIDRGKHVVLLTDCARAVSIKVLKECGIDPDDPRFTYKAWNREDDGPPKLVSGPDIFLGFLKHFDVLPNQALSVGDNLKKDILPAVEVGMQGLLISSQFKSYDGPQVKSVEDMVIS